MVRPKGTRFNDYSIIMETTKTGVIPSIRRWVVLPDGRRVQERYPVEKYKEFRDDPQALKDFVIRLNRSIPSELKTREAVEIKHAYINTKMLDDYLAYLKVRIPKQSVAKTEWGYLKKYVLGFFVTTMNLPNPLDWHRHQTEWAHSLLGRDDKIWPNGEIMSARFLKDMGITVNRFCAWLHDKRPNEVPPLKFSPFSTAVYKDVEAERERLELARIPRYILDKDWDAIQKALPENLKYFVLLGYNYGLRRAEMLGLKLEDVRTAHLALERQLVKYSKRKGPTHESLKDSDNRRVPHWNCSAPRAYELIENAQKYLMNPTVFGHKFAAFMKSIKMTYTLHDLRHTWTTKMIQKHMPEDVRKAAGHEDLTTTMNYIHHGEALVGDEVFVPEKAS